ncbi:probable RNA 2'-phosphotransferase [Ylistrum balloti]|uniref:probable RNA 2'-phosphotransferase n=1 Tax=Ylistrum balloti TaxID=509963 RepID=UPI00290580B1|nr:probable RNA 2'-phosphotransferase [Ylistrum balloti]
MDSRLSRKMSTKKSKAVVKRLRHDRNAWRDDETAFVPTSHILRHFRLSKAMLDELVFPTNDKQRLVYSDNHKWIRASYGHSVNIRLPKIGIPVRSGENLTFFVHGMKARDIESVLRYGLDRNRCPYVDFTDCPNYVRAGAEVLVHIDVRRFLNAGFRLYNIGPHVFATEFTVPPEFISDRVPCTLIISPP